MNWPRLSVAGWKLLVSLLALFVASMLLLELRYAPRQLADGAAGYLGIRYHRSSELGRLRFVIDEVAADSPLLAAGARPGDSWIPDRLYDARRRLAAGERIGLTLVQGATRQRLTVTALREPAPGSAALHVVSWFVSLLCLGIGLLIGFRQAESLACRALSAALILFAAFNPAEHWVILPAGAAFQFYDLCWRLLRWVTPALLVVFAFNFPDDIPRNTPLKSWVLRHVVPVMVVLWLLATVFLVLRTAGFNVPWLDPLGVATDALALLGTIVLMWNNWRSSQGELRQRHLWILLSFFGALAAWPVLIAFVTLSPGGPAATGMIWAYQLIALVTLFTLSYAVLRHHVIGIGFAVNRAVVYSAASVAILLAFGVIEWVAHHLLAFEGRAQNVLLDATIALGVYLAFHRLRHAGEKAIERLLFHSWHVKEEGLREFLRQAPFITRSEALMHAFVTALERYTDGAAHALYRRTSRGSYQRMSSTLAGTPEWLEPDEPLVLGLRVGQKPVFCADVRSALPGELALPGIHHGQLDGFILLDSKPGKSPYRPDEQESLANVARQVGLDFRALWMEELAREVLDLRQRNRDLQEHNTDLKMAIRQYDNPPV